MLHHNGNKFSSIPLVHAVHVKEVYENLQVLLQKMCCEEHGWNMCADLNVLAMLTGLQGRYTKFFCFVCDRDCQARDCHYRIKKKWPLHSETTAGQKNVAHLTLVDKSKIYLPPLHIKLGVIKIFVKAMNKESEGFTYLRLRFPKIMRPK